MTTETKAARPPFLVAGRATILHLNIRKEGPDDEKVLAVDVKLEVRRVGGILAVYFDAALPMLFWLDDDAMGVRNAFMRPVGFANEITGASVKVAGLQFVGVQVKKMALEPVDGGMLTFSCSLAIAPSADEVAALARLVQVEVTVFIEGPPDLFDGDQGAKAAGQLDGMGEPMAAWVAGKAAGLGASLRPGESLTVLPGSPTPAALDAAGAVAPPLP
jgi:hypothetical protein